MNKFVLQQFRWWNEEEDERKEKKKKKRKVSENTKEQLQSFLLKAARTDASDISFLKSIKQPFLLQITRFIKTRVRFISHLGFFFYNLELFLFHIWLLLSFVRINLQCKKLHSFLYVLLYDNSFSLFFPGNRYEISITQNKFD